MQDIKATVLEVPGIKFPIYVAGNSVVGIVVPEGTIKVLHIYRSADMDEPRKGFADKVYTRLEKRVKAKHGVAKVTYHTDVACQYETDTKSVSFKAVANDEIVGNVDLPQYIYLALDLPDARVVSA